MDIQKLLITYKCDNVNEVVDHNHSQSDNIEILNLKTAADTIPETDNHVSKTPGFGYRSFDRKEPTINQLRPQPELDSHPRPTIIQPIIIRPQVIVQSCSCPYESLLHHYYYYYRKQSVEFFNYYDNYYHSDYYN